MSSLSAFPKTGRLQSANPQERRERREKREGERERGREREHVFFVYVCERKLGGKKMDRDGDRERGQT